MTAELHGKTHTAALTAAETTEELRQRQLARLRESDARIAAETPEGRAARMVRIRDQIRDGTYPTREVLADTALVLLCLRDRLDESERRCPAGAQSGPAEYQRQGEMLQAPDDTRDQS
jgi:hypothetical protein